MNLLLNTFSWIKTNQQALTEELVWLQRIFEAGVNQVGEQSSTLEGDTVLTRPTERSVTLEYVSERFGLTPFERTIVLLCAGIELQSDLGILCGKLHGSDHMRYPTFGLALSVLPEAHWSALTPQSPLRVWQLIQIDEPNSITSSRLRIDERILHFLFGDRGVDQRLNGFVHLLTSKTTLSTSQQVKAEELAATWSHDTNFPDIVLQGNDVSAKREVSVSGCRALDMQPLHLWCGDIPADPERSDQLAILLAREFFLSGNVVVMDAETGEPPHLKAFFKRLSCPVIFMGDMIPCHHRSFVTLTVTKPTTDEQFEQWQRELGDQGFIEEPDLRHLAVHFNFSAADIENITQSFTHDQMKEGEQRKELWHRCSRYSRESLDQLAQRVTTNVVWDDLVLSSGPKTILRDISRQVKHRATVYNKWGFADKNKRGLGICALFTGESGTGKTMAAEVLATDLNLDLYRIDLSSVVSKYIGETEKNLERLFVAAETSGAILLFDEADALFGRRSEVKDSHDRYANIELAYLLQRMESYRGLSILTSNMKSALDSAFLRRIRFFVHFSFPNVKQRAQIWQNIFPEKMPREELRVDLLARLNLTGGNIRNVAMNGAFLAAENKKPLSMNELAHAVRLEYAKLEKPLNEKELSGWI